MTFIFATQNTNKMTEVRRIMEGSGITVISMDEAGADAQVVEDGDSFAANAVKKAAAVAALTGVPALADDSGLAVDFLGGEPGVYSARYLGEDTDYAVKNAHIIKLLHNAPDTERTARFVCAIAAAFPDGRVIVLEETLEGEIARRPAGSNGFGYDPILYVPSHGMTTAEMTPEQKDAISHRGKALRAMRTRLLSMFA